MKKNLVFKPLLGLLLTALVIPTVAAPADSPEQVVNEVAQALADGRPQVAWQALPASYQSDISALIQDFASKMDAELWDTFFNTLNKTARVLGEKKGFILNHPMVAEKLENNPDSESAYDAVVVFLNTLLQSDISNIEYLRQIDVEGFLAGTGAALMAQLKDAQRFSPEQDEDLQSLQTMRASLVSSNGDSAVVFVEADNMDGKEVEFVRVEGKWVPQEMAEDWDREMGDARAKLAEVSPEDLAQNKAQIIMSLSMFEGVLDGLLAAQSEEEFNQSIQGILGMAMMAAQGQN